MSSKTVDHLIEQISKVREDISSLKTDMVWLKRGLYIVGTAAAGQAASALMGLFK